MKSLFLSVLCVVALILSCQSVKACEGHYETRYQTVLVYAGHYEQRFVYAPVWYYGRVVSQGRYISYFVPPQYATRAVQVWVADPPRYAEAQPAYSPEPGYQQAGYPQQEYAQPACDHGRERGWSTGSFFINIKGLFGVR